jgi:predicted RNA-binding Zn-ribbon protein involved in translation (DUF1610 family)
VKTDTGDLLHMSRSMRSANREAPLPKLVDVTCPSCGVQSKLAAGLLDVDSGELVNMCCPGCGLDLESDVDSEAR